jgi:Nucleoside-diphosphate-sugar pyrophosphorylase involved in lipopolysaccharide biosynthesis/translation initiation factor 2B, gamma/epsilon subunits (eIF-2Bgamma/eIF-2Bepsilon)
MKTEKNRARPLPALLLAAGLGTRLSPITDAIPKCLVPINGIPLLGIWLDMLGSAGMEPLIVNTHHFADRVADFVKAGRWREKTVLAHEPELLGTGGTLLANRRAYRDETVLVIHADNLSSFDVAAFVKRHDQRPASCVMTMMLFRTPTPESCGIVELDDRGVVGAFHEKVDNPPGNLANAAVYLMEREALDILAAQGKEKPDISLDLLPRCLGKMYTWENQGYHRDIGTPESYAAALREYRSAGTAK